ncbi:hypothetical protein H2200_000160 [Cladophialophora chaetospira]|uniref:DUF7726 domain-containing protein n=1 Tax=Cladophialophora chaetospira TaxID=386627 RepID=A0AA38XN21_9EURO|nr:hypothetical protein H2200_000160 [Cladophialophora chaetospira]
MSPHQDKQAPEVAFLKIASNLSDLSKVVNMPAAKRALKERDTNIPTESANKGGANKKRKSDGIENAIDPDDVELPPNFELEWSANQVRAKIRQFVNSGEMKVGEFQTKIGVGSGSYNRFMSQNGPDKGLQSETFGKAAEFFKRRELAGLKMPSSNKKRKTAGDTASGSSKSGSTESDDKKVKTPSKKEESEALERSHDVSDVHLDGEDTESVPVYDTCDDIRTKTNRFLRETPSATNASFIRLISAALPSSSKYKPTARQLPTFLGKKGPSVGAESAIFYASYVFFEKLRVKKGAAKTKKRVEMEERWTEENAGFKGMPLMDMGKRSVIAKAGCRPSIDKYGDIQL